MTSLVIEMRSVAKSYPTDGGCAVALNGVDLYIRVGERVAIVGGSGSGKTTLLSLIGCLDRPSKGTVVIAGMPTDVADDDSLAIVRNDLIGFVFQHFHLIRSATVLQNVELPLYYRGVVRSLRRQAAYTALQRLGMETYADRMPNQLSGGQQQRVAIARAIVGNPDVILADEPTGNLDLDNAEICLRALLHDLEPRRTLVIVTHDASIARRCGRIIRLAEGKVVDDERIP